MKINLLDLKRGVESLKLVGADEYGIVKINMIKVDGVIEGGENANDEELLIKDGEGLTNGFRSTK